MNKSYEDQKKAFDEAPLCCICNQKPKVDGKWTCESSTKCKKPPKFDYKSFFDIRNEVILTNETIQNGQDETKRYMLKIPYNTRERAVKKAVDSRTTCIANLKAKNIKHFKLGFKSKHDTSQIAYFDASSLSLRKQSVIFCHRKEFLGITDKKKTVIDSTLRFSKRGQKDVQRYFNSGVKRDYSVILDGTNYYICVTMKQDKTFTSEQEKSTAIALDPGIRTFATGFDTCGRIITTSSVMKESMKRLHTRLDKVTSFIQTQKEDRKKPEAERVNTWKAYGRKTKTDLCKLKKLKLRLFKKLRDSVDDSHKKISSELAKRYDYIIFPEFGTSKMLKESTLSSVAKRNMASFSFFRFKQQMLQACKRYQTKLIVTTEEFTSKTCSCCGHMYEINSDKTYKCRNASCGEVFDRDINAAKNIFVKTITSYGQLE